VIMNLGLGIKWIDSRDRVQYKTKPTARAGTLKSQRRKHNKCVNIYLLVGSN